MYVLTRTITRQLMNALQLWQSTARLNHMVDWPGQSSRWHINLLLKFWTILVLSIDLINSLFTKEFLHLQKGVFPAKNLLHKNSLDFVFFSAWPFVGNGWLFCCINKLKIEKIDFLTEIIVEGSQETSSPDGNGTTSILHFTPEMKHIGKTLICKAVNSHVPTRDIYDEFHLNISCK